MPISFESKTRPLTNTQQEILLYIRAALAVTADEIVTRMWENTKQRAKKVQTIMRHLRSLEDRGLVESRIVLHNFGTSLIWTLTPKALATVTRFTFPAA